MKIIITSLAIICSAYLHAQNVGIGTTTPDANALLHVNVGTSAGKGMLVTGTYTPVLSTVPDLGTGSRMMFYPGKAAFRAGYVNAIQWDNLNVGVYSAAIGLNTTASGESSTAMGFNTLASGDYSTAMGFINIASGPASNAMGSYTTASGAYSTAMGQHLTASGGYSTAMGNYVSTSGFNGAFAIGDNSSTTIMESFVANGFRARFAGGYRLLTNNLATIGVVLLASGNAWSAISDIRLKEKFLPVDGESFLKKIAHIPLTTWNYKDQDAKTLRHYGPMAQDFYNAFGHDALGEIGCDTLINQQDFLGVNLIAIQALEKRTENLEEMKQQIIELQKTNAKLENDIKKLIQSLKNK